MGYVKVKDRREIEESWKGMEKLDWKRDEKERLKIEIEEMGVKIREGEKEFYKLEKMKDDKLEEMRLKLRMMRNKWNRLEVKVDWIDDELDWDKLIGDLLFVKSKNGLGFFRGRDRGRISKEKVIVIIEEKKDNKKRLMVMCDDGIVSVGKEEIMKCCVLFSKNNDLIDEEVCDEDG